MDKRKRLDEGGKKEDDDVEIMDSESSFGESKNKGGHSPNEKMDRSNVSRLELLHQMSIRSSKNQANSP